MARVGETQEEVEVRYGAPIPNTHPMLKQEGIRNLLSMPNDQGVGAHVDYLHAMAELLTSPYEAQATQIMGQPRAVVSNARRSEMANAAKNYSAHLSRFQPILYLHNNILIQVVYFDKISISEEYANLVEEKNPDVESGNRKEVATNKMSEWFRLGEFSYRIKSAKISKTVVSANDLENQLSSMVSEMLLLDLKNQINVTNLDLDLPDQNVRFVIIDYDIRNEAKSPSLVLTDDFRIEDARGRQFTTDGELTKRLIETSDKSLVVEVLQPGVERSCRQGFRVPTNAVTGQLCLNIPEKGVFSAGKSRVIIKEGVDPSAYSITPIDSKLLKAILEKTLEKRELPNGLKPTVKEALPGYYDYVNEKWSVKFNSKMALEMNDDDNMSRIFLNFTGKHQSEENKSWEYNPLYQIETAWGFLTKSQAAKKIREALKQAKAETEKVGETVKGF